MTTRKNWRCDACNQTGFYVRRTFPKKDHIIRWLKCKHCKENLFTKETILNPGQYLQRQKAELDRVWTEDDGSLSDREYVVQWEKINSRIKQLET